MRIIVPDNPAPPIDQPQRPSGPYVPVLPSKLEGLSSCCLSPVTYADSVLCCKACYQTVSLLHVNSKELEQVLVAWVAGGCAVERVREVQVRVMRDAGIEGNAS